MLSIGAGMRTGYIPLDVVPFRALYDAVHEPRIAEEGDSELSVVPAVHPPGEDLVDEVIHDTMQEVVPRKVEEQILSKTSAKFSTMHEHKRTHKQRGDDVGFQEPLLESLAKDWAPSQRISCRPSCAPARGGRPRPRRRPFGVRAPRVLSMVRPWEGCDIGRGGRWRRDGRRRRGGRGVRDG